MPSDDLTLPVAEPPQAPREPGVWSGLGIVALYFVLQLVASFVLGIIGLFVWGVVRGMHHHELSVQGIAQLAGSPPVLTLLTVGVTIMATGSILWVVHRIWPLQWRAPDPPGFGFVMPASTRWFLGAVAAGLVMVFVGGWLTQLLAHGHDLNQDVTVLGRQVSPGIRILLGIVVVCVAPLAEELIFRGVLLSGLMRRVPVGWAVFFSALVFGCVHLPDFKFAWYPIPGLVLFGVVLALLRLRSRSLWVAVTAHATNNLVGVVAWFVMAHAHG